MHIDKKETMDIHPHKAYGYRCGQYVSFMGKTYMFLGYVDGNRGMIATHSGDKKVVFLNQIFNTRQ